MEPDMMESETPDYFSFMRQGAQAPKKKRKRGGLAGVWDRNKNIIAPVVSGALGMIPGVGVPLAAAAGGLMRGLDRPGKSGIGFDVKQGLRGAAQGALAGSAGRGLSKFIGGGGGAAGIDPTAMAKPATSMSRNAAFETAAQPSVIGGGAAAPMTTAASAGQGIMGRIGASAGKAGGAATRGLGKLLQSPEGLGMSLQALSGVMGSQEQRRLEEQRLEEERRRAENLARFAMPLYLESMQRRGGR